MTWSFRLRFRLGRTRVTSTADAVMVPASDTDPQGVILRPWLSTTPTIGDTQDLVLTGEGYRSREDAQRAANRWRAVLQITFAKAQIGVDFGRRAPVGGVTTPGLDHLSAQTGHQVTRDQLGPVVFETNPLRAFSSLTVTAFAGRYEDHVLGTLAAAAAHVVAVDETNRLAFDLFGASFFVDDPDARMMLLMMAVETLMRLKPRTEPVLGHVEALIAFNATADIPDADKQSIASTLNWLRKQSIGQAGKDLAATLGDRRYLNMPADKFFTKCYGIRSSLAHGHKDRPHVDEVDRHAAPLEVFVADLLSGPLLDTLPTFEVEGPGRAAWDAAVASAQGRVTEGRTGRTHD